MNDGFKIYVDQLRKGNEEEIHEEFQPDFLDVNEKDLSFKDPVKVEGRAYQADDSLILHFEISTLATLPCAICNEPFKSEITIHNFYHAEPIADIKSGIFNFKEILRETILLEAPKFGECHDGKCPERIKLEKFLKEQEGEKPSEEEGYRPFSDFDWNNK